MPEEGDCKNCGWYIGQSIPSVQGDGYGSFYRYCGNPEHICEPKPIEWRPDRDYQAKYQCACGYWD